ncbi:MAG: cheR, partial [Symbiobacteriaceae bacterium]|nr:cheR [Symbiobacteriaceae bacterium]
RNVVIYFTEEAKDELYRRFHRALKPGGILFVGGTESLLKARELGYASVSPFFYRAVK